MRVVYEDNHLIVVLKPENMPTQADSSGDLDLLTATKDYIKKKYDKPGAVYLGLLHRLDRPVGGLIAFARTSKAASRLSEQLRTRAMHRQYLAVVRAAAPAQGEMTDYLLKQQQTNTTRVVKPGTPGAKIARLSFETLGRSQGLSLLRVTLFTGRSHQIRVQLANAGYPIWGDARYGNGAPGEQIALFAAHLTLEHPTTREQLTFNAPPPRRFPFGLWEGEETLGEAPGALPLDPA